MLAWKLWQLGIPRLFRRSWSFVEISPRSHMYLLIGSQVISSFGLAPWTIDQAIWEECLENKFLLLLLLTHRHHTTLSLLVSFHKSRAFNHRLSKIIFYHRRSAGPKLINLQLSFVRSFALIISWLLIWLHTVITAFTYQQELIKQKFSLSVLVQQSAIDLRFLCSCKSRIARLRIIYLAQRVDRSRSERLQS